MENNRLDKFFKSKLEERSFEYNASDWENALKLIEKEEQKDRPLWIWWGAAAVVMIGLFLFTWNWSDNQSKMAADFNPGQKLQNEQRPNEQNAKIIDEESITESSSRLEKQTTKPGSSELLKEDPKTRVNSNEAKVFQQEVVPKTTTQEIDFTDLPDPISGHHPKSEPKSSPVPKSEVNTEERSGEEFLAIELTKPENDPNPNHKLKDQSKLERSVMFNHDFQEIAPRIDLVSYFSTARLPRVEPFNEPDIKLGFGWGLNAFVNPYVGSTGGGKDITGFSIGAVTSYRFSKMLSLNADLQYTYRTGTFEKSNISKRRRYKFTAEDIEATLNPTALHYASLPVYAGIHFSRHRITFGGSLNYLAGVRGGLNDKVIDGQGNIVEEIDLEGWISKDGFNALNPGAMIGYDYTITNRWSMNFRSNYLFNSIIDKQKSIEINSPILKEHSQLNLQIGTTFYFK
ncbi:MAG: PorT family protein [Bacteroidia bacterium]|nr:PorT family protein [Bacteroidia bacterium]